jgi:hypothetical protein
MSKISNAIKKAAVALQMTAMSHENPAPVEGTQVAAIQPAEPNEDRDIAVAKTEAARIVTRLATNKSSHELSAEDRAQVIAGLALAGPPMNAFVMNRVTGKMTDLAGNPIEYPIGSSNPAIPSGPRSKNQQRTDRHGYIGFKSIRHPKS